MMLILQILGGLFLFLILVVVVGWWLIKWKIRTSLEGLRGSLEQLSQAQLPARIHLKPREQLAWKDAPGVERLTEPLFGLGFQDAGLYETEEIDSLRLRALAKPEQGIYAAVWEHDQAGIVLDLVTYYQDGTTLNYTTGTMGAALDQRPGHGKERHPELDAAALYQRMVAERPPRPVRETPPAGFSSAFEKAYADEMDWRNSRGGPTEEELRAVAAQSGMEMSDDELALAREQLAAQAAAALDEALRERFVAQTAMSAAEWEEVRERVVFVHERLTPDQVAELFEEWTAGEDDEDWDEEDEDEEDETPSTTRPEGPPRAAFAALNETLPGERRFRKIGELAEPVLTDVYVAPEE